MSQTLSTFFRRYIYVLLGVAALVIVHRDKFPVTTGGRIVGALLMTGGVGLFGTFTAFVSSWFLRDKKINGDNDQSKTI